MELMTAFLSTMTEWFSWGLTNIASAYDTIIANPGLTIMCLGIPVMFVVPRFLNSLFRVN